MKKIIVYLVLAGLFSACSQYTCPTYTKNENPKPEIEETGV